MPSTSPVRKIFLSRWFLIAALVISALVAFAYARAYYQDYQVRQEIARLQDEVRRLETKKLEALEILRYAQSMAFVEERARMELNMTKPGEKVAIFLGSRTFKTENRQENQGMIKWSRVSNMIKWWNFFMGKPPPYNKP